MPEVIRAQPDTTFQFIGADPPRDVLRPNVEYTGFVVDISSYLRRANFVIASMMFGHGMSTKIVTALAFGKTVLASPQAIGAIAKTYLRDCDYQRFLVDGFREFFHRYVAIRLGHPNHSRPAQLLGVPDLRVGRKLEIAHHDLVARAVEIKGACQRVDPCRGRRGHRHLVRLGPQQLRHRTADCFVTFDPVVPVAALVHPIIDIPLEGIHDIGRHGAV